jgi:ankyrin repeat protein
LLQFSKSAADTPLRETNIITEALLASTPITWCRPLHNALDDPEMLKVLLDGGADMNLADCEGFTPLMEAIHTKNEGATKVLLAHGADFTTSCPTHNSTTSLDEAVLSFTHAILDQLDIGDPRNDMSTDRGRAILREAQKNRKWDIVQSLIKHCPQKDCIGKILDDEETLLYAIKRATESVVDFLLANGANPNHQLHLEHDDHWALPISVTAKRNSIRKAKSLLKHGARLLLENSHGMLPVEHAIFYGERKTVSWFLEETITAIKKETRTTQIASTMTRILVKCASDTCHMGSLETLQLVLTLAKQEVDNIFQQGPFLHLAVHYGRIEITKYLLASGFNVHQLSPEGCSALDMAFSPLDAEANRLGNKREDYEECIKLVQKAVGRGSPSTSRSSKSSTQKRR